MHTNLITGRTAACCGTAATVCVWDGATNLRRTAAKVMTLLRVFVWRNETKHGGKREASTTAPPIKTQQRRRRRRRSALVLSRWSTKIPRNSSLSSLNLSEKQTKKKSQTNNPCGGFTAQIIFLAFTGVSNLLCTKTWLFSFVTWLLTQGYSYTFHPLFIYLSTFLFNY